MKRDNIDVAIIRQLARMEALLNDVARSGGKDRWPHLFSHGHKFPTVKSAVERGYLKRVGTEYEITPEGRWLIDNTLIEKMRRSLCVTSTHQTTEAG